MKILLLITTKNKIGFMKNLSLMKYSHFLQICASLVISISRLLPSRNIKIVYTLDSPSKNKKYMKVFYIFISKSFTMDSS